MKKLLVIVLLVLGALAAVLFVRGWKPASRQPEPPAAPVREAFHVSKPLRVELRSVNAAIAAEPWLERELRFVLARGKMRVTPLEPAHTEPVQPASAPPPSASVPVSRAFTLRVALKDTQATLELVAPDGVIERKDSVPLQRDSRLATIRSLAQRLPQFLGAPLTDGGWDQALGTDDAAAYDVFAHASDMLLAPTAHGFTRPVGSARESVQTVEQLESLLRRHRNFARARALLALAYLSVGGEDEASLEKLAVTAAERALTGDAQLADAHAALGIVRMRKMDWSRAEEHFTEALAIDDSSLAALEGSACLSMDVGHTRAALPIAIRAAQLQPASRGARECARYAQIANALPSRPEDLGFAPVGRIDAAMLLLAGDTAAAEKLLNADAANSKELTRAVIEARTTRERIPEALQVITRSADDGDIDADTELLFGIALKRPDFVFNRMLRLGKQNEAVPLRLVWLPQTDFLRKHRRFREIVSATALTAYWQDHGVPDICANEPKVQGCAAKAKPSSAARP